MRKKIVLGLSVAAIAIAVACGKTNNPASPSAAGGVDPGANADGSNLKIGAPALVSPANNFQPPVGSTAPFTLTWSNVSGTYASFPVTYEVQLLNGAGTAIISSSKVAAASGATTSMTLAANTLAADTPFSWRVRATYQNANGPMSSTRTFRTAIPALVFDPLTDGKSVGQVHGGSFVPGRGWRVDRVTDGIDYDLPPCPRCRVEFDVTNQDKGDDGWGKDLKWLTMGDAGAFGDFGTFRNHDWKMHLELRGDGDGTAMKLIWRVDGDDDDHATVAPDNKVGGPNWTPSETYHFVFSWTENSYLISINGEVWFEGGLQGPYVPPTLRVSLGCYPRGESMVDAIFRNVLIKRQ